MSTKLCQACSMQVSAKLWTAHIAGRKHKQKVGELKAKAAPRSNNADKRPIQHDSTEAASIAKRPKLDVGVAEQQKTKAHSSGNEYACIPEGFFDNPEQNDKTEATIEKQKLLDTEYQKFMNEISAAEQEVAAEDDVDVKVFTHERQMESIDDTMGYWKALNALEKRKEAIAENHKHEEEDDEVKNESDDDEEFEVDFEGDNWRSRKIF